MLEKYYGNFRAEAGEYPVILSCLGFQNQEQQMDNQGSWSRVSLPCVFYKWWRFPADWPHTCFSRVQFSFRIIVAGDCLVQRYICVILFRLADFHLYNFIPPYREAVVGLFLFVRRNHLVFNIALIPCDKGNRGLR